MSVDLVDFLESLGVKFDMDWDNTVSVTVPDLDAVDVEQAIKPFRASLEQRVAYRAECQRAVYVGGSLNGRMLGVRPYRAPVHYADGSKHIWIVNHVARGRWEVYDRELGHNGRAFFRGYATNKKKAMRGEISETPRQLNESRRNEEAKP